MGKKNIKKYYILVLLILGISVQCSSYAATNDAIGFTYENEIPKNQIGDHTYFELKVKPGDEQVLVTNVSNNTDKEMIINVVVSDATTSSTGEVDYGSSKEQLLGKDSLSLKEMIEAPAQVKLKAKETKSIKFKLKVPKSEFDGVVLGGIQLKQLTEESKEKEKGRVSLDNEYSYIYSISIKENDKKVETEIKSSGTKYNQLAYTTIENKKQKIVSGVKIESLLMGSDSDKVLNEFKVENYRMAPNSKLEIPIEGTKDLEIGKYRTQTTVSIDEQQWKFDSDFEITKENKKNVDKLFEETPKEKTMNWFFFVIVILLFVGLTAGIFYLLNKKKK